MSLFPDPTPPCACPCPPSPPPPPPVHTPHPCPPEPPIPPLPSPSPQTYLGNVTFSPGRYTPASPDSSPVSPYGTIPYSHITLYDSYASLISGVDPVAYDIAIIKLDSPVGDVTGWMGIHQPCQADDVGQYVASMAGYPTDRPGCMTEQCTVINSMCSSPYLYHYCDTMAGQSGSAMWVWARTGNGGRMGPLITAVHNVEWSEASTNGSGSVVYVNSAVAITPSHYSTLLSWISPSWQAFSDVPPPA